MIETVNLRKHYGRSGAVKAVDGVDLRCADGEITGLLGPNGAGKTTTLRMIAGLVRPMSGTVLIDGSDAAADPKRARSRLGVQSDATGVYPRLTAREQLGYYGRFYGLRGSRLDERVGIVMDMLKMGDFADRRAEGFSRGQRQKIVIGRALVHDPPNIIMDEPTNGLDVLAVRDTREIIRSLRSKGKCVLFSTHYMDEAERLCDRIAIIQAGRILASGTPRDLMERTGAADLEDAFTALAGPGSLSMSGHED